MSLLRLDEEGQGAADASEGGYRIATDKKLEGFELEPVNLPELLLKVAQVRLDCDLGAADLLHEVWRV
jgi:hypothetical protein